MAFPKVPRERAELLAHDIMRDFHHSVRRIVNLYEIGDDAMDAIIPEAMEAIRIAGLTVSKSDEPIEGESYTGERRDLVKLFGCRDWVDLMLSINASKLFAPYDPKIKIGDYVRIPIKTSRGKYDGLEFDSLNIPDAEAVVVDVIDRQVIFQFEEVLFHNAVNNDDTNKGGFEKSALSSYLNNTFLAEVFGQVLAVMVPNYAGKKITLPTRCEVFGEERGEENSVNWSEFPAQLGYFKKVKNRIRVREDDTKWWWLSSAAHSTSFANVSLSGNAYYDNASGATGGVAPVFCIS
jgi:hypothetical protein